MTSLQFKLKAVAYVYANEITYHEWTKDMNFLLNKSDKFLFYYFIIYNHFYVFFSLQVRKLYV